MPMPPFADLPPSTSSVPSSSDDPTDRGDLPDPAEPTVFAAFRAPAVFVEEMRERAAREGVSLGELLAYAWSRLLQLEDTTAEQDLAALPEEALRAALRGIQSFRQSGKIAAWVTTWVGETRARQLHPPSPDDPVA